jgi:hypothetical protein
MINFCSVSDDPTAQEVLRAWLNDRPGIYASAEIVRPRQFYPSFIVAGFEVKTRDVDNAPIRRTRSFGEVWEENQWTVVNTTSTVTALHAMAAVGDMPLSPVGFESNYLAGGGKITARTAAWPWTQATRR